MTFSDHLVLHLPHDQIWVDYLPPTLEQLRIVNAYYIDTYLSTGIIETKADCYPDFNEIALQILSICADLDNYGDDFG